MMIRAFFVSAAMASLITAQTQLVRGDVDTPRQTNGIFVLDCTRIPLTSTTVDLQALHNASRQQDVYYDMQVREVRSGGRLTLDVVSAEMRQETMDMGNLRFGRSETWEVFGRPNSRVAVFVNHITGTSYSPVGGAGTWLVGLDSLPIGAGSTGAFGRFQFRFTMPTIPSLVGQTFIAQAALDEAGALRLTEPDCKEVRND